MTFPRVSRGIRRTDGRGFFNDGAKRAGNSERKAETACGLGLAELFKICDALKVLVGLPGENIRGDLGEGIHIGAY